MPGETNPADEELMRLAIGEDDDAPPAKGDDAESPEKKGGTADDDAGDAGKDDLGADETGEVGDEDGGEETDEGDGDAKRRKTRSKPEGARIAELTARLRQTERALEEARAGTAPADEIKAPERPDPAKFEYGDSDPDYHEALTDWKIKTNEDERDKESAEAREQQAVGERLAAGIAFAAEQAKAKYDDFDERIAEAVDARGGEPLPVALRIAIAVSSVGGDLAYKLATDEGAAAKLEELANGGDRTIGAFALALGEAEGEFVEDESDSDLDPADPVDMNRLLGRMRARLKAAKPKSDPESDPEPKQELRVTSAPTPAKSRVRGGTGRFDVSDDTDDFAAFEAKVMGGKK